MLTCQILNHKRIAILLIVLGVTTILFSLGLFSLVEFNNSSEFNSSSSDVDNEVGYFFESKICDFPKLNPYHPTILQYIKHPLPLNCTKIQPDLTFVDYDGFLQFNQTEMDMIKMDGFHDIKCYYKLFDAAFPAEAFMKYYREELLVNPVPLWKELVEVKCSAKNDTGHENSDFYFNLHAHPAVKPYKNFSRPTEEQLSVVIMAIDSLSYSALKRNMPLTYNYIKNKMFIFESFNKVGENTLPNLIPLLTGKRFVQDLRVKVQKGMHPEVSYHCDYLPLITKQFSEKGYATMINEDRPDISLFAMSPMIGFSMKPVDYYYQPFWQAVQENINRIPLTTYCYRNLPAGEIFLDITRRHTTSMKDTLQFIMTAFNTYSHEDDGTSIECADESYMNFFRDMIENDYFNKTVLIFMSDHGNRLGPIRKSLIGSLEDRNPMLGIRFPDWFYAVHPNIKDNLSSNKRRLTTAFDVHETLKDILHANYNGTQRTVNNRGMSILYRLPVERTCTQAGIPRQYCLCIEAEPLNQTDHLQPAAIRVVKHLNEFIASYDNCHKISFKSIVRAEKLLSSKILNDTRLDESSKKAKSIRLTIETEPNGAEFESNIEWNDKKKIWLIDGTVHRVNAYKKTADCMKNKFLKNYCTCKNETIIS